MTRPVPLLAGFATLGLVWLGPLPAWAGPSFSAHMLMHLGVLAIAAPLLALGLPNLGQGRQLSPAAPLFASVMEFIVVSMWHVPAAHDAARTDGFILAFEQTSFLVAGLLLWSSALHDPRKRQANSRAVAASGMLALLLTSMHMTLLGALIALAPRQLFRCEPVAPGFPPISDQQVGGALMLAATGTVYLVAGLMQLRRLLDTLPEGGDRIGGTTPARANAAGG